MPDIYASMAAVMDDVKAVAKTDRNEAQRFLFRGVDSVVNAVGPSLRDRDVIVVPEVESVDYEPVQTKTGTHGTSCRVLVTYRFYALDGSNIAARVAAEATDYGDKAAPKAMSVAFRIALLQALALPTDDPDPDAATEAPAEPVKATRQMSRGGDRPITPEQSARMFALFGERGITEKEHQLAGISKVLGRNVESRKDLTVSEATRVMDSLAPPSPPDEEPPL